MAIDLEFKRNLPATVERMDRLWNLEEPLDRVPALVTLPAGEERRADGSFFGRLDAYLAFQERSLRRQAEVADDAIPVVYPQFGHALIAALCGAPISGGAETVWVQPCLNDLAAAADLHLDWGNPWAQRFLEVLGRLQEWASGRCVVANYEVEGVSDTMAALRGAQQVILDAYDCPAGLDAFAARVTDVLIEFGHWCSEHVGQRQPLLGGETVDWRLWMPPDSIAFTEDATVMCDPAFYRRHIQRHDTRLASAFTRTMLEVHHEGNHQIEAFGEVPGVSLLTVESFAGMQPRHRDAVRRLLGKKAFMFSVRPEDVDDLLAFTGVRGVLLSLGAPDAAAANRILADLERATERHRRNAAPAAPA
ncbi:MAG: hypothetical protein ACYC5O_19135 [Anaerolineae bacterium]